MLRMPNYSRLLIGSAEMMELTNVKLALINILLDSLSKGHRIDQARSICLSLSHDQIAPTARAQLIPAWVQVDLDGDTDVKLKAREVLTHLLSHGNVKLSRDFWETLSSDLDTPALRGQTTALMRATIRAQLSDGICPLLDSARERLLVAETAMEHAFSR